MKFEHLQGSIVAMVTPFRADGSVNFDALEPLCWSGRSPPGPTASSPWAPPASTPP